MNHQEAQALKSAQMEIMDEIHRICTEFGITYFMVGGTLIGAVRHHGFIPWDVDIDVAMPREDYLRFKEVCRTELHSSFFYRDHTNTRNFNHPHALLCKKNTLLYTKFDEYNPKAENLGIYVDIFPLDYAPETQIQRKEHDKRLKRIACLKNLRLPYCYSPSLVNQWGKALIRLSLFWISVERINELQQKEMMRYYSTKTDYMCNMAGRYSYEKECHHKDIFGTPEVLSFDGRQYLAPEHYHEYLSQIYGDYMKLPPEEDQKKNQSVFTSVEFQTDSKYEN